MNNVLETIDSSLGEQLTNSVDSSVANSETIDSSGVDLSASDEQLVIGDELIMTTSIEDYGTIMQVPLSELSITDTLLLIIIIMIVFYGSFKNLSRGCNL